MTERVQKLLYDILFAIESIEMFVGQPQIFENYCNDYKTKSATERQFGIIGEAVNKIKKENLSITISNAKDIVGLRNRIVHAYDSVNDTVIWAIIVKHLPELKKEINGMLTS